MIIIISTLCLLLAGIWAITISQRIEDKKQRLLLYAMYIIMYIIATMVNILIIIGTVKSKQIALEPSDEELQQQVIEQMTFEDSVFTYIVELNIKHPNVVLKQAKIESGNFKSKVYLENNNMFGFKRAFKRANTQVGTNRGYAVYTSWRECVIDYALYQTYSAKNLSREEYINFLGKHYAEDPNYKNLIR